MIEPVSTDCLSKTGVFTKTAGDFPRFPPQGRPTGSLETKSNRRKARISSPIARRLRTLGHHWTAWPGRKESNLDIAISKSDGSCLFETSCKTPLHWNSQVSRNTRISRAVPNPQSPELWREMSHSEKKGRILPIRGPELKSEIAGNTGVHYQHPHAEKQWPRRSWRAQEDSNPEMTSWKSEALARPRETAEPLAAEVHK
jgi:hypothetical protein